ncbi:MAG: hypothetical protein AB7V42_16070 [Thermoleophilia bacterium]
MLGGAVHAEAATGRTAFSAGFEQGLGSWTKVVGAPRVQSAVASKGRSAMMTPRRRGVSAVGRVFAPATRVTARLSIRAKGGSQTFLRFPANRVSLVLDGSRRLSVHKGAKRYGSFALRPADGWHTVAVDLQAGSNLLALKIDGRLRTRLRLSLGREDRIQVGDLDARPSGPVYFDGITVVASGQRTGGSPTSDPPGSPSSSPETPDPAVPPGRFFSPTSIWNAPLAANAALDDNSAAIVADLAGQVRSSNTGVGWINTDQYSTPVYTVPASQKKINVNVQSGQTVDAVERAAFTGVPIPPNARPSNGSDHHLVIYQPSSNTMWEFFDIQGSGESWTAHSAGKLTNVSASTGVLPKPSGATASGLALVGGMITIRDAAQGSIDHALSIGVPETRQRVVAAPANRTDGYITRASAPPQGAHFRLDPTLDVESLDASPFAKMLARAAQKYGIIVRDTSGTVTFYGEDPSPTGSDPWPGYFGGEPTAGLRGFPWERLQLLKMSLSNSW